MPYYVVPNNHACEIDVALNFALYETWAGLYEYTFPVSWKKLSVLLSNS